MSAADFITKTFNLKLGNVVLEPQYWQAAAIILLLFLFVWTLARLRHTYVSWSLNKSSVAMVFWGFILALIIEGFLLVGGKTMLTEILSWENVPKPISTALDAGRAKLVKVLGVADEVPTYSSVVSGYQSLPRKEATQARLFICQP